MLIAAKIVRSIQSAGPVVAHPFECYERFFTPHVGGLQGGHRDHALSAPSAVVDSVFGVADLEVAEQVPPLRRETRNLPGAGQRDVIVLDCDRQG